MIFVSFFITFFEACIFENFYINMASLKASKKKLWLYIFIYTTAISALHFFPKELLIGRIAFLPYFYDLASVQVVCFLWFYAFSGLFSLPKIKRYYFACLLTTLRFISEAIALMLPLQGNSLHSVIINDFGADFLLSLAISKMLLFFVLRKINRHTLNTANLTFNHWFFMFIIAVAPIVVVYYAITIIGYEILQHTIFNTIVILVFAISNYLLAVFYDKLGAKDKQRKMLETELERYKKINEWGRQLGSIVHDTHTKIRNMQNMLKERNFEKLAEELASFYGEINGQISEIILPYYPAIDFFIREKIFEAKSNSIEVETRACLPAEIPFDDADVCLIIGNAMSNAIEACNYIDGEKKIFINFSVDRNRFIMTFKNTSLPVEIVDDFCHTIKPQSPFNGHGITKMATLAEKYNGKYFAQYADGYFMAIIFFSF